MRLDIFRRAEKSGNFSYLAIPEGKEIPQEATNIDWEVDSKGVDLDDRAPTWGEFDIDQPMQQISMKGYAISRTDQANSQRH